MLTTGIAFSAHCLQQAHLVGQELGGTLRAIVGYAGGSHRERVAVLKTMCEYAEFPLLTLKGRTYICGVEGRHGNSICSQRGTRQ
jgi:hypothetical protein